MKHWQTALEPTAAAPAPMTGVYLGRNKSGPMTMRLFRPRGTRIVVFSGLFTAQLITLRAAVTGASVRVMTGRESAWMPLLQQGSDSRLLPPQGQQQLGAGPRLLTDDRPDDGRPFGEADDWQCLVDVRTAGSDDPRLVDESRIGGFGGADVAFFSVLKPPLASLVGTAFGLGDASASLTVVPPHAVAIVTRGSVQLVRLEATQEERAVLRT